MIELDPRRNAPDQRYISAPPEAKPTGVVGSELEKEKLKIVIVGGGITGYNLADRLASDGLHPTIVSRTSSVTDLGPRYATPIVNKRTADRLGIPIDPEEVAEAFRTAKTGLSLMSSFLNMGSKMYFRRNPYVALDLQKASADLHSEVAKNPKVDMVNGVFSNVEVQGNRVTGVKVKTDHGEEMLTADLVIDATGRNAAVAKMVKQVVPDAISESQLEGHRVQVSGGYVAIDTNGLHNAFPNVEKTMYAGALPSNATCVLTPTILQAGSRATHLLLVEGDPTIIGNADEQARKTAENPNDMNSVRLETLRLLSKGSQWEKLVNNITYMDRPILFTHREDLVRKVDHVQGLVLAGDAAGYTNPFFGRGLTHVANDVDRLSEVLKNVDNVNRLNEMAAEYNNSQAKAADRKLSQMRRNYRVMHGWKMARRATRIVGRAISELAQ